MKQILIFLEAAVHRCSQKACNFKACVSYFLKTEDTSSLKTYMKLQLQTMFTCISITRKPKLYVAMFHASLCLLLEVKRGQ